MRRRAGETSRRLARARPPEDVDARILPLINIVFLLLVFFMFAGRLSPADPFEITPPDAANAGAAQPAGAEILLGPDAELALGGHRMDRAALLERLARRLGDTPDLAVRVRADRASAARRLVVLMQDLRRLGARDVTLITQPANR